MPEPKKSVADLKIAVQSVPGTEPGSIRATVAASSPGPKLKRGMSLLASVRN
jgi:hypothetical protein